MPPLPVGPKQASTEVLIVATEPAPNAASSAGWIYNPDTGEIIGNVGGSVGGTETLPPEILDRLDLSGVGGGAELGMGLGAGS
jgi:hypothetical protein